MSIETHRTDSQRQLLEAPATAQALLDLGVAAFRAGSGEARRWFARAAVAAPDEAATHFSVAVTTPDSEFARRSLSRALAAEPTYVPAWLERAAKDPGRRVTFLLRAFAIDGDNVETAASLGGMLLDRRQTRLARAILDHGLRLTSQNALLWVNAGRASVEEGDWFGGQTAMRRAVALAPAMFEAWMNIGAIAEDWGDRRDGIAAACRAVVIDPSNLKARWNRILALLASGDWKRGFADHDVRLALQQSYPHALSKPRWQGEPVDRLLVHDEIGYGDVFNFIRYLPLARSRVGSLTFETKPGLAGLLAGFPGVDRLIERGSEPPDPETYDAVLPMESLPALFRTTVDTVPPVGVPLAVPAEARRRWDRRLADLPGPRVGLCWAGNRASGFDHKRSSRLADLEPILSVPGVSFVSLQKEGGETDPRVVDLGRELADFADTAAVISKLDLVISVETSVAHLAGAMARPVWILLAANPAWRWLMGRSDSPWYPTARLFRCGHGEPWLALARRAAAELRTCLAGAPTR